MDLRRSLTIILVKYGDRLSEMIYDEMVQLKLAAILLYGNTDLNNCPSLSVNHKLGVASSTFVSQRISAFRLSSPGRTIPRPLEVDAVELSPWFTEETTDLVCFLSRLCFVDLTCFFLTQCCIN